jgi:hypothetical protein
MSGNGPDRTEKSASHALGSRSYDESLPELDEAIQQRLGRLLARCADELVLQPMPDVILLLLAKMQAKERGE